MSFAVFQATLQWREARYIASLAQTIINDAYAQTPRERVIALRDYIRTHVTSVCAPLNDRPFLRATAADTLQAGIGYCGEMSRAFINLADAAGVPTARLNLYGRYPHVVAYADIGGGDQVVVDCMTPPLIVDLETLDQVMMRGDYTDYSTLNLHRLHLDWLFERTIMTPSPITHWGENPHAIKAVFWASIAGLLLFARAARKVVRALLARWGWVHVRP